MSEVRVRTLEELKAAKAAGEGSAKKPAAQSARPAQSGLSSSSTPASSAVRGLEATLIAARGGETDRVRQLCTEHPSLRLDHADADGYSLLHGLAQHNHPALLALLLEKSLYKASAKAQCIDAQDKWGVTPLMLASVNGNGECTLMLLRHGASTELVDHKGFRAEDHAKKEGHGPVLRAIREASSKRKRGETATDGSGSPTAQRRPPPSSLQQRKVPAAAAAESRR